MGEGPGALPAAGVFARVLPCLVHLFICISFPFPVVGIELRALYILGLYSIIELLPTRFYSFKILFVIITFIAFGGVSLGLYYLPVCPFIRSVVSAVGSLPYTLTFTAPV